LTATSDDLQLVEDPAFQTGAAQAADLGLGNGRTRSPGAAAVGQTALVLRLAGGLLGTVVVARFSVALAIALLVITMTIRVLLRRHWMRIAEIHHGDGRRQRLARYWTNLATEPEAAKELRIFGLDYWTARRYQRDAVGGSAGAWRALFHTLRAQGPVVTLSALGAVLALGAPAYSALHHTITAGVLVTTIFAAFGMFALSFLGTEVYDIAYGGVTVQAYDRLVQRYARVASAQRSGDVPQRPARPAGDHVAPAVRFEDVLFEYRGASKPALEALTLELPPGEVTALVGRNGVGKTTLIKLLTGLYQPSRGRITVNGLPLTDLDPAQWRSRFAILFQDFVRYPETLRSNIVAGAPEAHDDLPGVLAATRRAGLTELVDQLPSGLDTPLWSGISGGVDLSGGQWQRVALARVLFAVAHGRSIVVLDEPTSHLDVAMEADFHRRIVEAMPGLTIVLISHRLSTVRPADTILLLSGGRIAESGDHDELMARQGEYARLYQLQAARFVDLRPSRLETPDPTACVPGTSG
jgi:ATP-binding cassette subfamily B protein